LPFWPLPYGGWDNEDGLPVCIVGLLGICLAFALRDEFVLGAEDFEVGALESELGFDVDEGICLGRAPGFAVNPEGFCVPLIGFDVPAEGLDSDLGGGLDDPADGFAIEPPGFEIAPLGFEIVPLGFELVALGFEMDPPVGFEIEPAEFFDVDVGGFGGCDVDKGFDPLTPGFGGTSFIDESLVGVPCDFGAVVVVFGLTEFDIDFPLTRLEFGPERISGLGGESD